MEILRGIYGLIEAGILANKLLRARLEKFGYFELSHTPGFWKHIYRPMYFTSVVDNFGIKYVGEEYAKHLIKSVQSQYLFKADQTGGLYCGIELAWNYEREFVDTNMRMYVGNKLIRYAQKHPDRKQYTPYAPAPVLYGKAS